MKRIALLLLICGFVGDAYAQKSGLSISPKDWYVVKVAPDGAELINLVDKKTRSRKTEFVIQSMHIYDAKTPAGVDYVISDVVYDCSVEGRHYDKRHVPMRNYDELSVQAARVEVPYKFEVAPRSSTTYMVWKKACDSAMNGKIPADAVQVQSFTPGRVYAVEVEAVVSHVRKLMKAR